MLTLPAGVPAGFSQQDLQAKVSAFDASSINQWWLQSSPTATPSAIVTASPTANPVNGTTNFPFQPMFLVAIILVIVVIVAVLFAVRRKTHSRQPKVSNRKAGKQSVSQPVVNADQPKEIFCPNCGNQLLNTKGSCPFCNSDLNQWYGNTRK